VTAGGEVESAMPMRGKEQGSKLPVFLTGGTGFLGSHLAEALARAGRRVILLVRPKRERSGEERVNRLLDWFGLETLFRQRISIIEGDILVPELRVNSQLLKDLKLKGCEFIHCASNTSFSERRRAEVEAVNLGGLTNVLEFAGGVGASFFHLVSTAYVAGRTAGGCPEEPTKPESFNNVYEETKCTGEWLAREACRRTGVGLAVYRPSIVYGHSQTGRSLTFNAIYYPIRTVVFLRKIFEKDILEKRGAKAVSLGIEKDSDGILHFPLRIEVGGKGGVNLVPIDYFVDAFLALMTEARDGDIFHIVSETPKPVAEIIGYTEKLFGLTGLRAAETEEFAVRQKNAIEQLFAHYMEAYGPYMRDERTFTTEHSRPILEDRGIACPDLREAVFARCMTYAISMDWGARLFA
jgi:nucleoside-diphosphate-sugar epimerase